MSTSQIQQGGAFSLPSTTPPAAGPAPDFAPTTDGSQRLPTPLERTFALVLADHDRRNLLGRWLTLLGVTSCRTALDSTPLTSLTPMSGTELVVSEAAPEEVDTQVISFRTRGWQNIVVSTPNIDPATAAAALRRDVRVLLRRSRHAATRPTMSSDAPPLTGDGAEHEASTPQNSAQTAAARLTNRECVVLQLVARGQSNREIGELLELSPLTIKSHLSRIGRKLGTGDRARMVLIALRGGVIS